MNKESCALKLVDEIILYYDARSKKHQKKKNWLFVYDRRGKDGKTTAGTTCEGGAGYSMGA